jgi:prostaglandin-endoperoxide synthase 2
LDASSLRLDATLRRGDDGCVPRRSTKRDGLANRLEFHVLTHYGPVWRLLSRPPLRSHVNRLLINSAVNKVPARPHPLSTLAPYTSWSSLTDRSYDARHLPPREIPALPPAEEVAELFVRRGEDRLCPKSTRSTCCRSTASGRRGPSSCARTTAGG